MNLNCGSKRAHIFSFDVESVKIHFFLRTHNFHVSGSEARTRKKTNVQKYNWKVALL